MNISIDSDGNVSLNRSFDSAGITSINTSMMSILNTLKTYDTAQIVALKNELNDIYPTLVNFSEFMEQWSDVLEEVDL